ncbi:DUF5320 domain-containing protein [Campylobacter pinnipediorum]|uniref:Uncharacterized protein n=1 Tax=Campylobacter pinnipediorum subsp. pinnipediorum TaxID=1660067 RepID=A0AAX0LAQ6_9BACT|nr:DUF5320 domain-containing protein [Campylobacter pinnipediorum]OPA77327.1 hypothetical protein BFG04_04325 [Campylobacter pinnipediorum subsp. pinnipediorum]
MSDESTNNNQELKEKVSYLEQEKQVLENKVNYLEQRIDNLSNVIDKINNNGISSKVRDINNTLTIQNAKIRRIQRDDRYKL